MKGLEATVDEVAVKGAWHSTCCKLDKLQLLRERLVLHDGHAHQHIRVA